MAPKEKGRRYLVNLNRATKAQLVALLGVSSTLADSIIEHRSYDSLDDLKARVTRLRKPVLDKFRSLVAFSDRVTAKRAAAMTQAANANKTAKQKEEDIRKEQEAEEEERKKEEAKKKKKRTPPLKFTVDPADVLPTPVLSTILKMVDTRTRIISVRSVSQNWRAALLQRSTWHDVRINLSDLTSCRPQPRKRSVDRLCNTKEEEQPSVSWSRLRDDMARPVTKAERNKMHANVHVFMNLLRANPDVCAPASLFFDRPDTVWSNEASFAAAVQAMKHVPKLEMGNVRQREASALEMMLGEFDNLRTLVLRFRDVYRHTYGMIEEMPDPAEPRVVCIYFPPLPSVQTLHVDDGCVSGLDNLSSLTNLALKNVSAIPDKPFSLPPTLTDLVLTHPSYDTHRVTASSGATPMDYIGRAVYGLPVLKHLSTNMLPYIMRSHTSWFFSSYPAFARSLQTLDITYHLDANCVTGLRCLSSVQAVSLSELKADEVSVDVFSAIGQMSHLHSLKVVQCAITDAHLLALNPVLPSLRHLHIEGPPFDGWGFRDCYTPNLSGRCLALIGRCYALESLTLEWCSHKLKAFSPLRKCLALRTLRIVKDDSDDHPSLSSLHQVTTLDIIHDITDTCME